MFNFNLSALNCYIFICSKKYIKYYHELKKSKNINILLINYLFKYIEKQKKKLFVYKKLDQIALVF